MWICETLVDGLPLIASHTGGTPELVKEGKTGLLYSAGDLNELTECLVQLARDPERLYEMRVNAFARGRSYFTPANFIAQTLEVYRALLDDGVTGVANADGHNTGLTTRS